MVYDSLQSEKTKTCRRYCVTLFPCRAPCLRRFSLFLQDPSNTWPGLISKPDPATIGRRLKALVVKYRDEKRIAARAAAHLLVREREDKFYAEIKEKRRCDIMVRSSIVRL